MRRDGEGTPLEERLLAHLRRCSPHVLAELVRDDDAPVADGLAAVRALGAAVVAPPGDDDAGAPRSERSAQRPPEPDPAPVSEPDPEPAPVLEPEPSPEPSPEPTEPVGVPGPAARPGQRGRARPDACLAGVSDADALVWAAMPPGPDTVGELAALQELLPADLTSVCRPVGTASGDVALGPDTGAAPGTAPGDGTGPDGPAPVTDAVLVEALAAAERCLALVTALRDTAAGVLATRRQVEVDEEVAAARAATAADGRARPWAAQARSTGPTEVAARLGITERAAGDLLDRGVASLDRHRQVSAAMSAGALSPALGSWLLDELVDLHAETQQSALERETATRTRALAAARAAEDATRATQGQPALSAADVSARTRGDAAQVDAEAELAARWHADEVVGRVRRDLLTRALGERAAELDDSGEGRAADGSDGAEEVGDEPPKAPSGLGASRAAWGRHLARAVTEHDPAGAEARAAARRAERSVARWAEKDGQACLQLRGPREDVALIGTAMDARAERRRDQARAAEREAARAEGRPFDRSAVGTLDAHRFEAVKEWAVAALELAGTSGVSGTWYPIARTAASRPVVSVTMPVTVPLRVTSVGAFLAGYGPLGAAAACRIAAEGFWVRVFTDPVSGVAVGMDEGRYRPGAPMRRVVGLRHPVSTMPGSTVPAERADLDHIVPWAVDDDGRPVGGATSVEGLHPLGRWEHLLKQAGDHAPPGVGWRVQAGPAGVGGVVWRAPTGHTYPVLPQRLDEGPPGPGAGPGGDVDGWLLTTRADVGGPGGPRGADWSGAAFVDDPPPDPVEDGDSGEGGGCGDGADVLFGDLPEG